MRGEPFAWKQFLAPVVAIYLINRMADAQLEGGAWEEWD
jgi:hypothetical protein